MKTESQLNNSEDMFNHADGLTGECNCNRDVIIYRGLLPDKGLEVFNVCSGTYNQV